MTIHLLLITDTQILPSYSQNLISIGIQWKRGIKKTSNQKGDSIGQIELSIMIFDSKSSRDATPDSLQIHCSTSFGNPKPFLNVNMDISSGAVLI